jgi:hypothetical protein
MANQPSGNSPGSARVIFGTRAGRELLVGERCVEAEVVSRCVPARVQSNELLKDRPQRGLVPRPVLAVSPLDHEVNEHFIQFRKCGISLCGGGLLGLMHIRRVIDTWFSRVDPLGIGCLIARVVWHASLVQIVERCSGTLTPSGQFAISDSAGEEQVVTMGCRVDQVKGPRPRLGIWRGR